MKKGNSTEIKKDLKTVILLWSSTMFGAFLAFIIQVFLARILGPSDYGQFSSSLIIVSTLLPFASFGIHSFWLKVFGLEGWSGFRWMKSSFMFLKISTTTVVSFVVVLAFLFRDDIYSFHLLMILSTFVLGQVGYEMILAKLQLEEKFILLAFWQVFQHFLRLGLTGAVFLITDSKFSIYSIAFIYMFVSVFTFFVSLIFLNKMNSKELDLKGHGEKLEIKGDEVPNLKELFIKIFPFGLATFFHLIYFQSDLILLKYLKDAETAGIYNVAFIIMAATLLLPSAIYQKYFIPKLHRWVKTDKPKFIKFYRKGNVLMLSLGLVVMIGILCLSNFGLVLIFGDKYKASIELLNILSLSIPLLFVASSVGAVLVTDNFMKDKVKLMGGVALLNIVLNLLLITELGAKGAAISTTLCNAILMIVYFICVQKKIPKL